MSMDTTSPSDARQQSIDARLDAIDRALLGLLPRHGRIALVAQIEAKISEAVAAGTPVDADLRQATRDYADALDAETDAAAAQAAMGPRPLGRRSFVGRRPRSRLAVSSGVLGIVALALLVALPIVYLLVAMSGDEFIGFSVLGGHLAAVTLAGLLAVVLGVASLVVLNRRQGRVVGHGWAITGLCTGPLPMFAGGLAAVVILAQMLSMVTVTPAYAASNVAVPPAPAGYPTNGYPVPPGVQPAGAMPGASPYMGGAYPPAPTICPAPGVDFNNGVIPYTVQANPGIAPASPPPSYGAPEAAPEIAPVEAVDPALPPAEEAGTRVESVSR